MRHVQSHSRASAGMLPGASNVRRPRSRNCRMNAWPQTATMRTTAGRWGADTSAARTRSDAQRDEIVRHRRETGVHNFVVHREQKHVLEMCAKQTRERAAALAVHVAGFARR